MEVPTVDYHTAGEPLRIVVGDVGAIAGANVRARRETAAGTERIDRGPRRRAGGQGRRGRRGAAHGLTGQPSAGYVRWSYG